MSVTDKLTALATALRNQYGSDDKLTLDDMAKGVNGLSAHNYINAGRTFEAQKHNTNLVLSEMTTDMWDTLSGKSVTLSFDVSWSGYLPLENVANDRVGMEWGIDYQSTPTLWLHAWFTPSQPNGKAHISKSWKLPQDKVTGMHEGSFFNQLIDGCKVKVDNIKVVVNPME